MFGRGLFHDNASYQTSYNDRIGEEQNKFKLNSVDYPKSNPDFPLQGPTKNAALLPMG